MRELGFKALYAVVENLIVASVWLADRAFPLKDEPVVAEQGVTETEWTYLNRDEARRMTADSAQRWKGLLTRLDDQQNNP